MTLKRTCSMVCFFLGCGLALAQGVWENDEMDAIADGVNFDIEVALERLEEKGVTPYDFGIDLLYSGRPDKAKKWFETLGIATKEPQYLFGLAWVKWQSGDNHGALKDGHYLIHKNPPPLIRARTLYLLGTINIDEKDFKRAREDLQKAFDAYAAIEGKYGGQYKVLTMIAWAAVVEGKYEEVLELLDRALEFNEKARDIGLKTQSLGRYLEIIAEMFFRQGDYSSALRKADESRAAYQASGELFAADIMQVKIGLLKLMTGEPKAAGEIAADLWERFHDRPDRARLLAYNEITLMKLDQCAQNETSRAEREKAVRAWATSAAGGKALLELLEFVGDRAKVPCPAWR